MSAPQTDGDVPHRPRWRRGHFSAPYPEVGSSEADQRRGWFCSRRSVPRTPGLTRWTPPASVPMGIRAEGLSYPLSGGGSDPSPANRSSWREISPSRPVRPSQPTNRRRFPSSSCSQPLTGSAVRSMSRRRRLMEVHVGGGYPSPQRGATEGFAREGRKIKARGGSLQGG
jgi:hypothetical protein